MQPIRSKSRQSGLTLIELMLVIMLSMVVTLGAGAVYRGVDRSFKSGAHKMVGQAEATQLSTIISRQMRVSSGYMIYTVPDRVQETNPGNGIALMDDVGNVTYRFEWNEDDRTLTDSAGTSLTATSVRIIRFSPDPVSPLTIRYSYRAIDGDGHIVDIESAIALRN